MFAKLHVIGSNNGLARSDLTQKWTPARDFWTPNSFKTETRMRLDIPRVLVVKRQDSPTPVRPFPRRCLRRRQSDWQGNHEGFQPSGSPGF
jgi:hypothetical protein